MLWPQIFIPFQAFLGQLPPIPILHKYFIRNLMVFQTASIVIWYAMYGLREGRTSSVSYFPNAKGEAAASPFPKSLPGPFREIQNCGKDYGTILRRHPLYFLGDYFPRLWKLPLLMLCHSRRHCLPLVLVRHSVSRHLRPNRKMAKTAGNDHF